MQFGVQSNIGSEAFVVKKNAKQNGWTPAPSVKRFDLLPPSLTARGTGGVNRSRVGQRESEFRQSQTITDTELVDGVRKPAGVWVRREQIAKERKFKEDAKTPGTVPHALRTIKQILGTSWADQLHIRKPVYEYFELRKKVGGPVPDGELREVIRMISAGDVRRLRTEIAAYVGQKYGKEGADPAIKQGLPFSLLDMMLAEHNDQKVISLLNGDPFSLDIAKTKIEQISGISYEDYVDLNKGNIALQIQGIQEQIAKAEAEEKIRQETENGKHGIQKFGAAFKNSVTNMANFTVDRAADVAAAFAADEYGSTVDEIKRDEEFVKTVQKAKAQTDMLYNVVLSMYGPTQGLMFIKDHVAPVIEYGGSRLSKKGGKAEGDRAWKEHLKGYDVTQGGFEGGMAVLNVADVVATVLSSRANGATRVLKTLKKGSKAIDELGLVGSLKKGLSKESLARLVSKQNLEAMGIKFSSPELTGRIDLDGDLFGRLIKARKEGELDWGSVKDLYKSAVKSGIKKSEAAAAAVRIQQTSEHLKRVGVHEPLPDVVGAKGTVQTENLAQMEDYFDVPSEPKTNLKGATRGVQAEAKKRPVFDEPFYKLPKFEAVQKLEDEIVIEFEAFHRIVGKNPGFYDKDIPKSNEILQNMLTQDLGRKAAPHEIALYHIISSLLSAAQNPAFDSEKGFIIFRRFLKALDDKGLDEAVRQLHPFGNKLAVKYVDGKRTGELDLTPDGKPRYARFSQNAMPEDFARLRAIIQDKGSIESAVNWLVSKHPTSEVKSLGRRGPDHEYLTGETSYGMFGLTGDKRASYALNRNGVWDVIAKDVWFTRTALRLLGRPLISTLGNVRKRPLEKNGYEMLARVYFTEAIENAADRIGIKPALVAQAMFSSEHWLYGKFGNGSGDHYLVSDGLLKASRNGQGAQNQIHALAMDELSGIANALPGGIRGASDSGSINITGKSFGDPQSVGREPGELHQRLRGTYNPVTKIVRLLQNKANITTLAHEFSGHWMHDVLKDHPVYGQVLEKHYGKFDVGNNRAQLEQFARDVETHWMTSRAPNAALSSVFDAIRSSFSRIYKSAPGAKAHPEIQALFDGIDAVMDDEIAGLIRNFEKVQGVERAKATLKKDALRAGGAAARSEQRSRERRKSVPLDGRAGELQLSPSEWAEFRRASL